MKSKLALILDECIELMTQGNSIESCLDKYPEIRDEMEPLLRTAQSVNSLPEITLTEEYKTASRERLLTRIRTDSEQSENRELSRVSIFNNLSDRWQRFLQTNAPWRKLVIPVAIVLTIAVMASLIGPLNIFSPRPVLAAKGTLTILSGHAEIYYPESDSTKPATDGMILTEGTRIKTSSESHVILTFFEGSTIKLDPDTDMEIRQLTYSEEESPVIILKQWLGRTWSKVIKMADPGSRYEIETPTAIAIVRGTLFSIEVSETGLTQVSTTEGLVSVTAEGQEVNVPAATQTQVNAGAEPSQPMVSAPPKSEIIITIAKPAVGSVSDPSGSSTGTLLTGLAFNQIIGSSISPVGDESQVIRIPEPVTGEYKLALRYLHKGTARFQIQGISEGSVVFTYTGNWNANTAQGKLIHFNLDVDDGIIVNSILETAEILENNEPEKGIDTKPIKKDVKTTGKKDKETNGTDTDNDKGIQGKKGNKGSTTDSVPSNNKADDNGDMTDEDINSDGTDIPSGNEKDWNIPPGQDKDKDKNVPPGLDKKEENTGKNPKDKGKGKRIT